MVVTALQNIPSKSQEQTLLGSQRIDAASQPRYQEPTETNEIIITMGHILETKEHCLDAEQGLDADESQYK